MTITVIAIHEKAYLSRRHAATRDSRRFGGAVKTPHGAGDGCEATGYEKAAPARRRTRRITRIGFYFDAVLFCMLTTCTRRLAGDIGLFVSLGMLLP